MLPTLHGSNQQPPDHQSDAHQTEPPRPTGTALKQQMIKTPFFNQMDQYFSSLDLHGNL